MWINTRELQELLERMENGEANSNEVKFYKDKISNAIKREIEREERRIQKYLMFCDTIYEEIKQAGIPISCTDIQFMIYGKTGQQWSCTKIAQALLFMKYGRYNNRYSNIEREYRKGRTLFYLKK